MIVTATAMIALLTNRTGSGGFSLVSAYSQPAVVNGCGMTFRLTESGSVLNDVIDRPGERDEHQDRVADQDRRRRCAGAMATAPRCRTATSTIAAAGIAVGPCRAAVIARSSPCRVLPEEPPLDERGREDQHEQDDARRPRPC